jgi:anti-sigma regulatory factor (Ser/Thr protein kinase)
MDFIQAQIEERKVDSGILADIMIACEEIVVNIIYYAYPEKTGDLEINFQEEKGIASIMFKDSGTSFNPLAKPEPDIDKPVTERDIGGLGILLVKKLMDDTIYEYRDNKNILTITKKIF